MTSLPDWLVERAALDEVPAANRDRLERAEPRELADGIAALHDDNDAELARHPAGPAVAQIEARAAAARCKRAAHRRRRLGLLGVAASAAAALVVVQLVAKPAREATDSTTDESASEAVNDATGDASGAAAAPGEVTRPKGQPRLVAYRRVGEQVERLEQDTVVQAGDVVQLRYNAGGQSYGVIASVDGAGVVTLHFPLSEDAPPQATAMAPATTTLPQAYALDDAPRFERFFFVTANAPIDVQRTLAALRALASRDDSATVLLELPAGMRQSSLRLRKPDRSPSNHESP